MWLSFFYIKTQDMGRFGSEGEWVEKKKKKRSYAER